MPLHPGLHHDWRPIDQAAMGLIYGAVLVLSLLMALEETPDAAFRPAIVLFGSVVAVTLAKLFSELLAHAIQTHARVLTATNWVAAWRHAHPTLSVANLPTLAILASGLGWIEFSVAVAVSQVFCVAILVVLGARVGWSVSPGSWLPYWGAVCAGGIGSALAGLKHAIH